MKNALNDSCGATNWLNSETSISHSLSLWSLYVLPSPLSTTAGEGLSPGFTQNPMGHIYYLATTRIALPHHHWWLCRFLFRCACQCGAQLTYMNACSCRPRAAEAASRKVPHDSAARLLPHGHSVPGARQTFMHPHTLSHTEPICIQVQEHTSTQRWHVNRHSQYTSKITPNSETVKMKSSYMADSGLSFCSSSRRFNKETHMLCPQTQVHTAVYSYKYHTLFTFTYCLILIVQRSFVWSHMQHQLQLHFWAMWTALPLDEQYSKLFNAVVRIQTRNWITERWGRCGLHLLLFRLQPEWSLFLSAWLKILQRK